MNKRKMTRRDFLRVAGTGAAVFGAGATIPSVLAQDPTATPLPLPVGEAGRLTVIHKTEYFEVVQTLFRERVVAFAEAQGIQLDISTANPEIFGDFTSRMLAAVQAGNPPDLGYHVLSIPQMYALDIVEDVTDVVEEAVSRYGAVVPATAPFNGVHDGRWWAVPFMCTTGAWFARRDLFEAAGIDITTADTWDARREAALAVSDPANNVWGWGFTVNRSGDGHGLIMSIIQGFGGSITDESGLVVTFNSPETLAAVEWLAETYTSETYRPMLPPGVESWGDTNNNESYLAGTIAMTLNQPSVYAAAKANAPDIFANTAVLHAPRALDGRYMESGSSGWLTIFKGAPNIDVAKELIVDLLDPSNITPMAQQGGGLFLPAYEDLWTDDLLAEDANFDVFRDILFNPELFYGISHPALPSALHDAVNGAGITSQMMANITANGMTPAQALEEAHDQIVQIWEESGVPQA
jgi:multiple sugar transport system substrate-binding protein